MFAVCSYFVHQFSCSHIRQRLAFRLECVECALPHRVTYSLVSDAHMQVMRHFSQMYGLWLLLASCVHFARFGAPFGFWCARIQRYDLLREYAHSLISSSVFHPSFVHSAHIPMQLTNANGAKFNLIPTGFVPYLCIAFAPHAYTPTQSAPEHARVHVSAHMCHTSNDFKRKIFINTGIDYS